MDDDEPRWASESVVRAVLAFAAVPGIILALGALYAVTADIARVDALSRVLQGAMLAIIGFYFGRVDVSRAYRVADQAKADTEEVLRSAVTATVAAQGADERTDRAERILEVVNEEPELRAKVDELLRRKGV